MLTDYIKAAMHTAKDKTLQEDNSYSSCILMAAQKSIRRGERRSR